MSALMADNRVVTRDTPAGQRALERWQRIYNEFDGTCGGEEYWMQVAYEALLDQEEALPEYLSEAEIRSLQKGELVVSALGGQFRVVTSPGELRHPLLKRYGFVELAIWRGEKYFKERRTT